MHWLCNSEVQDDVTLVVVNQVLDLCILIVLVVSLRIHSTKICRTS
uniref:Uncharacterized protein n=1 Tax=Rhizophora mucronata TaxID=61149 RepID=A0A2P2QVT9_RHIMU